MLRDEVIICSINLSVPGTLVGFERQIARLILFIRSSATMVESKTSTKSKQTLSSILVGKTYENVMTRLIHKEKNGIKMWAINRSSSPTMARRTSFTIVSIMK